MRDLMWCLFGGSQGKGVTDGHGLYPVRGDEVRFCYTCRSYVGDLSLLSGNYKILHSFPLGKARG
jgi:hypothetical protein